VFLGLTPQQQPPRLVLVVAHPDDETFGCGSLLLSAADAGWRTTVLCASRGEAGEPGPGTDLSTRSLGDVREAELREAAALLGVAEVVLLGFVDSGMEGDAPTGSLVGADPEELTAAVRRAVDDADPDVVVTLDGSDGHRDHVAIRHAAVRAAQERDTPVFLQCLARSLMDRWALHMSEVQPDLAYLRGIELGTPDDEVTHTIDTSELYDARLRAMAAHASQTSPFDALPEDLKRAFLTREHLVQVG
jgi:LmbE family N-acetylglucosaminyl deacetylase